MIWLTSTKKYAYAVGFPIKKKNLKKGDDGELRYMTLTCSHEGRRIDNCTGSLKPQPTVKMGAKLGSLHRQIFMGYGELTRFTSTTIMKLVRQNRGYIDVTEN